MGKVGIETHNQSHVLRNAVFQNTLCDIVATKNVPVMVWAYECNTQYKCLREMYVKNKHKLGQMHLIDNNALKWENMFFFKKFGTSA